MHPTALIIGVSGQDGSYLAHSLLGKGYRVCGTIPHIGETGHLPDIAANVEVLELDLGSRESIEHALENAEPTEIYNLGAQSHVGVSFDHASETMDVNATGVVRLLEAINKVIPDARLYQASTSEMFGISDAKVQSEETPFNPVSPYGIAKLAAHRSVEIARRISGCWACCGIAFNHESPIRPPQFVTRKVVMGLTSIRQGAQTPLRLGALSPERDWGFAGDYVEAMWQMLQLPQPEDLVLATGESYSVRHLVEVTAEKLGFNIVWTTKGNLEMGIDSKTGKILVETDPLLFRPIEIPFLKGDASKAKRILGWKASVSFDQLIDMMLEAEISRDVTNR